MLRAGSALCRATSAGCLAESALYASVLTKSLSEALPPGYVTVERERSMSDRMRGRPGEVSKVAVKLGDQVMTLAVKNGQAAAEICREVRGVVLSRQTVPAIGSYRILVSVRQKCLIAASTPFGKTAPGLWTTIMVVGT